MSVIISHSLLIIRGSISNLYTNKLYVRVNSLLIKLRFYLKVNVWFMGILALCYLRSPYLSYFNLFLFSKSLPTSEYAYLHFLYYNQIYIS